MTTATASLWQRFARFKENTPWWPYAALVICIGFLQWQTDTFTLLYDYLDYAAHDALKGWNKATVHSKVERLRNPSLGTMFVFASCVLILLFGIMLLFAKINYRLFHKGLLKREGVIYSVLYGVWLLAFWRGCLIIFNGDEDKITAEGMGMSIFAVTVSLAYAFIQDHRVSRRRQAALLQQKTAAELEALKAQVNPHFLFNTLNNLYGTAISESASRTADSIQQLAGIMRYVMQESQKQTTDIQNELRFIDDYIHLHEIRLPRRDTIQIETDIVWDEQPAQLVPLLLNPLIENAFKYGISMEHPSFVRVRLRVERDVLDLTIENSVHTGAGLEKGSGVGLNNVRQRLELAYPGRYTLLSTEQGNAYETKLTVIL